MKVITVINDQNNMGFNLLRLSCALNDLELITLVSDEKKFSSNRIKDMLLKHYLDQVEDPDEVIFFTDGMDAIMLAGEEEILSKYKAAGKRLLFSCESDCWPDPGLAPQYPAISAKTKYRYLNSGGFIGTAGIIRQLLDETPANCHHYEGSNQYVWTKRYFMHPHLMGLDTACDIFHTFSPEVGKHSLPEGAFYDYMPYYMSMKHWFRSNFNMQNNRLYSKIAQTWPCQAHFNGYSKCLIDYEMIDLVFSKIPRFRQPQFIYESSRNTIAITA